MAKFDEIPEPPEAAFLYLEKIFRDECAEELQGIPEDYHPSEEYMRYMIRTLAAFRPR